MEKMMMPAYYNVLSTEEMTYTEGGATATMTEALLCWLIPPYGWFKGVTAVRDYRRKNPNTWTEKGLDALTADMNKSTANAIRDIACTAYMISSSATGVGLIINAAIVLLCSILSHKTGSEYTKEQSRRRRGPFGQRLRCFYAHSSGKESSSKDSSLVLSNNTLR